MGKSYKALKEDFVSGLTGGSISEINTVTAVAPVRKIHRSRCIEISLINLPGCLRPLVRIAVTSLFLRTIHARCTAR